MPLHSGQPTKLTPALQQAIVNAVAAGVSPSCAGELAGLSVGTVSLWMQRGAGLHPTLSAAPLYVAFFEAIRRAQASDQATRIARLNQAGRGGAVIWRKTVTRRDGSVEVEERTQPPDWQADAWHLERRYYEQWGRKDRMDIRHLQEEAASQIASEYGMDPKELRARAERRLALVEQKRLGAGQDGTG